LDGPEAAYHHTVKFLPRGKTLLADSVVLKIIPDPLIRVQFRGVGRKIEEAKTVFDGFDVYNPLYSNTESGFIRTAF